MELPTIPSTGPSTGANQAADRPSHEEQLRAAAQALEASFLAQMLDSAGVGEVPEGFGGGEGEGQFASFLRQAQAEEIVRTGGIGLAESIYESLLERTNE